MRLLIGLLALGLAACKPEYQNPNEGQPVAEDQVRLSYAEVDPILAEGDARAAHTRGQNHLIGIFGITTIIPGLPNGGAFTQWPAGVLFIEDTGDAFRDEAHLRFTDRAGAYAAAYNRTILTLSASQ